MNGQYSEFNQEAILEMVKDYTIDESLYTFGDVIVNTFDAFTGIQDDDGLIINFHVVGFNDGLPVFTGLLKSTSDRQEAIEFTIQHIKTRIMRLTLEKLMGLDQEDEN